MENTYTLNISRSDICRLMTACTSIIISMRDEAKDPNCNEYRREHVLPNSIQMWEEIHDRIEAQLDEQDKKQPWYTEA